MTTQYTIAVSTPSCRDDLLSLDDIERLVGLQKTMIRHFVCHGLIDPSVERPEPLFDPAVVRRIRTIVRLRNDLGLNFAGIGLALDLLTRIQELEQELAHFRLNR